MWLYFMFFTPNSGPDLAMWQQKGTHFRQIIVFPIFTSCFVIFSELQLYFFLFDCRGRRYASSFDVLYVQILSEDFSLKTFICSFLAFFYQLGGKRQISFYLFHHQVISADKTAYHCICFPFSDHSR